VHSVSVVDGAPCTAVLVCFADGETLYRAVMLAGDPGTRLYLGFGELDDLVRERLDGKHPGLVDVDKSKLAELEIAVAKLDIADAAEVKTLVELLRV
jgi:hypothetical protein